LHSCLRAGDVSQTILALTARNSNERQAWHEKEEGEVTAIPAGTNAGKSREVLAAQYQSQALAEESH